MGRLVAAVAIAALLGGCSTLKGPPPVMRASGPYSYSTPGKNVGLIKRFQDSAATAAAADANQAAVTAMLDDGFMLVYAHCNDFFLSSGREQSSLLVLGDAVAALGTLATGAIALGDGSGDRTALGIVSLGTAATVSGINIYTQRFLFGADNVDAVRELSLNALTAHMEKVRTLQPASYQSAVMHLFDNQAICTPRRIAILAREAIQKGNVVAAIPVAGGMDSITQAADEAVLKNLGSIINPPGAVSPDQAGALYWLFFADATTAERTAAIRPLLASVPDALNPFDATGALKNPVPRQADIELALSSFSSATRRGFTDQIKAAREDRAQGGAAAPLPGQFALSAQPKVESPRVSVRIQ